MTPVTMSNHAVDRGVSYAADDVLRDDDFLTAISLELKADDVDTMRRCRSTKGPSDHQTASWSSAV